MSWPREVLPSELNYSARAVSRSQPGLRDTTRVASGDPVMWREILMENRTALLPALRELRDAAEEMIFALDTGDGALLQARLEEARNLRHSRYP